MAAATTASPPATETRVLAAACAVLVWLGAPAALCLAGDAPQPGAAPSASSGNGAAWQSLFNVENLEGWKPIAFGGEGEVEVRDAVIRLRRGEPFTGIRFTNTVPTMNYEVSLEARRVSGTDFFCGLTAPVGDSHVSLVVGGWGGGVMGLSSLDGMDASENETMTFRRFEQGRWYGIRLRVTANRLQAWLDDERVVDVDTTGRRIGLRLGPIEECRPLGLCSFATEAEVRAVRLRTLKSGPGQTPGQPD